MSPEEQAVELEYAAAIYSSVLSRCARLINAQIDDPIDLLVCLTTLSATLLHTRFPDAIERHAAAASLCEATCKLIRDLERKDRSPDAKTDDRNP